MNVNRVKHQKELVNKWAFGHKILVAIYVFVVVLLSFSLFKGIKLLVRSRTELDSARVALESESDKLVANQQKLDDIQRQSYIEKVARDTLGLAKDGELVFILPEGQDLKKLSPRVFEKKQEDVSNSIPNWKKWLQLFI